MLVKFHPNTMNGMRRTMNHMAKEFMNHAHHADTHGYVPHADIYEKEGVYSIFMDLPGVAKEDVKVNVENKELIIKGERKNNFDMEGSENIRRERRFGSFERTYTLSDDVNIDDIKAKFDNGVLELTIPLKEEVKPKEVEIAIS